MRKVSGFVVATTILIACWAGGAMAGSQTLAGTKRWLAVASTQNLDEAKGIAKSYGWTGAKVMSSKNGWFAVVLGPYDGTNLEALRKADSSLPDVPKDALLSRGDKYIDVVFEVQKSEANPLLTTYSKDKPAQFSIGGLTVNITMAGTEDAPGATEITGKEAGKQVFAFKTSSDFSEYESYAGVLKLDPDAQGLQVVVTRYTGGAHCCTTNWIVTKPKGAVAWTLVEAGTVDGAGGYSYEDVDGDGAMEIRGIDNAFLYAFDSYAGSMAPEKIMQLRGTTLKDVTTETAFLQQARQDLASMEFNTKLGTDMWHANGFLAGWVAKKIQLGEGDAAWSKAMANYDKNSDFGPQVCASGQSIEDCPSDNLKAIPFPKALAQFLSDNHYLPLPAAAQKELQ